MVTESVAQRIAVALLDYQLFHTKTLLLHVDRNSAQHLLNHLVLRDENDSQQPPVAGVLHPVLPPYRLQIAPQACAHQFLHFGH